MAQPSQSLIKTICYPNRYKFTSLATKWGCEHEMTARNAYSVKNSKDHTNMNVSNAGLIIHPNFPHFGASPDGVVECDCCGRGVLEVKCPFSCRERSFLKASEDSPSFCLEVFEDGQFRLKRKHAYFYQVQLQMKACEVVSMALFQNYWVNGTQHCSPQQATQHWSTASNMDVNRDAEPERALVDTTDTSMPTTSGATET